jgi:hypothetical protein
MSLCDEVALGLAGETITSCSSCNADFCVDTGDVDLVGPRLCSAERGGILVDRLSGVTDRIDLASRSRLSTECKLLVDLPDLTTNAPLVGRAPFIDSDPSLGDNGEDEGSPKPILRSGDASSDFRSYELVCIVKGRGMGDVEDAGEATSGEAMREMEAELAGRGIPLLLSMPSGTSSSSSSSSNDLSALSIVSLGRRMPRLKAATLTFDADISSNVRTEAADVGLDMVGRVGGVGFQSSPACSRLSAIVSALSLSPFASSCKPDTPDTCLNPFSWKDLSSTDVDSRSNTDVREETRLNGRAKKEDEGRRSSGGRDVSVGRVEEAGLSTGACSYLSVFPSPPHLGI